MGWSALVRRGHSLKNIMQVKTSYNLVRVRHFIQRFRVPMRSRRACLSHCNTLKGEWVSYLHFVCVCVPGCLCVWTFHHSYWLFIHAFPKRPYGPGSCGATANAWAPTRTIGLSISENRPDTGSILCRPGHMQATSDPGPFWIIIS